MRPIQVSAEFFGSYDRLEHVFDSPIAIYEGRNGHGKSTLIEVIAWTTWGESIRGGSPVRRRASGLYQDGQVTRATVTWDLGNGRTLAVTREHADGKTQKVRVSEPGMRRDGVREQQAEIDRAVGSFEAFATSAVFSKQTMAAFSAAKPRARAALLQKLLGLGWIDEALEATRADLKAVRARVQAYEVAEATLNAQSVAAEERVRRAVAAVADVEARRPAGECPTAQALADAMTEAEGGRLQSEMANATLERLRADHSAAAQAAARSAAMADAARAGVARLEAEVAALTKQAAELARLGAGEEVPTETDLVAAAAGASAAAAALAVAERARSEAQRGLGAVEGAVSAARGAATRAARAVEERRADLGRLQGLAAAVDPEAEARAGENLDAAEAEDRGRREVFEERKRWRETAETELRAAIRARDDERLTVAARKSSAEIALRALAEAEAAPAPVVGGECRECGQSLAAEAAAVAAGEKREARIVEARALATKAGDESARAEASLATAEARVVEANGVATDAAAALDLAMAAHDEAWAKVQTARAARDEAVRQARAAAGVTAAARALETAERDSQEASAALARALGAVETAEASAATARTTAEERREASERAAAVSADLAARASRAREVVAARTRLQAAERELVDARAGSASAAEARDADAKREAETLAEGKVARAESDRLKAEAEASTRRLTELRAAAAAHAAHESEAGRIRGESDAARADGARIAVEFKAALAKAEADRTELAELECEEAILGVNGFRHVLFARYLTAIETAANAWLSRMEPGASIRLRGSDETASGRVIDQITFEVEGLAETYENSSEGERRRIDIAVLMAIALVVGSTAGMLWFDEAFDVLDDAGVEQAAGLIEDLARGGKLVQVISHNAILRAHLPTASVWMAERESKMHPSRLSRVAA